MWSLDHMHQFPGVLIKKINHWVPLPHFLKCCRAIKIYTRFGFTLPFESVEVSRERLVDLRTLAIHQHIYNTER